LNKEKYNARMDADDAEFEEAEKNKIMAEDAGF
jgi:hypothetical protein